MADKRRVVKVGTEPSWINILHFFISPTESSVFKSASKIFLSNKMERLYFSLKLNSNREIPADASIIKTGEKNTLCEEESHGNGEVIFDT